MPERLMPWSRRIRRVRTRAERSPQPVWCHVDHPVLAVEGLKRAAASSETVHSLPGESIGCAGRNARITAASESN